MTKARLAPLLAISILFVETSVAYAGNEDGILLGNDAAMMAGAVTAHVSDGSGLWYNPAGLAGLERNQLEVSASAFVLRLYQLPGILRASSGENADGSFFELISVPSVIAVGHQFWPDIVVAIAIFVPQSNYTTLRASVAGSDPDGQVTSNWVLTVLNSSDTYKAGIGIGWRVNSKWRVGAALFGSYTSSLQSSQFWGGYMVEPDGQIILGSSGLESLSSVGLEGGLGVQWFPTASWKFGLAVHTPGFQLGYKYRSTSVTGFASVSNSGDSEAEFAPSDSGGIKLDAKQLTPFRIRAGATYDFGGGVVSLDADIQTPLEEPALGVSRHFEWNVRAGARFILADYWSIGAGLFTDRSASRLRDTFATETLDFYGGTLGLEYGHARKLAPGEGADDIRFSTTLGLRYAFGFGHVGGLAFESVPTDANFESATTVHAFVQELSAHLGTTFLF